MDRTINLQLDAVKKEVLRMGELVESAMDAALQALTKRQSEAFEEVHRVENLINQAHIEVDNHCLHYLAKQGPVAKDLRFIFSLIKINADLERMGDQAVNIAHTGKEYILRKPIQWPQEIDEMNRIVRRMVRESLDSFIREDVDLAKKILLMDDEVDLRKDQVFKKMTAQMKSESSTIESAMDLILIARNLERLGDHATNIAEDVIFVSTGKDVRHGGKYTV